MENQRAIRRNHADRKKKHRRQWWGHPLTRKELGQAEKTPTPCSCWMCGNPRKYFGERSVQERCQMQERQEDHNANP